MLIPLHVISTIETSGRDVLVINTKGNHFQLSAINAVSGKVLWQRPYLGYSNHIGAPLDPVAIDGVVVDLDPAPGSLPTESTTEVPIDTRGIKVSTDKVAWDWGPATESSEAIGCAHGTDFCIGTQVARPTNGFLLSNLTAQDAIELGPDVYADGFSPPIHFEQLGPEAQVLWSNSVDSIFGSAYNPAGGSLFERRSDLDIGWISVEPMGAYNDVGGFTYSLDLSASKSVGINPTNGTLAWSAPGALACGGPLAFTASPVLCETSGTATLSSLGQPLQVQGVHLQLAGLNPVTGATTWRVSATNVSSLLNGNGLTFSDDAHLVVGGPNGRQLLDLVSGASSTPVKGKSAYWCEHTHPLLKIGTGVVVAAPTFSGCAANGVSSAGFPTTRPSGVGVTVGGRFVFSSPKGLEILPTTR